MTYSCRADIAIVPTGADINVYKADTSTDKDMVPSCCTKQPSQEGAVGGIPSMPDYDLNELVGESIRGWNRWCSH